MTILPRLLRACALFTSLAALSAAAPVITEFMASNRQTLADNDGEFSDWIEIHNPDAADVDLGGWYLTDSASRLTKWQFPAVVIPANGYLVVFASSKDRRAAGAPLHTNFALSADGEYLALVAADGTTVVSTFAPAYPNQSADVSFGLTGSGSTTYLQTPTPGAANTGAVATRLSLAQADGTTETFSSTLPIIVLDNKGAGAQTQVDGEKEGAFQLLSGGMSFSSAAGLKVRGSSSADFPKKSYSIELHDASGANSPAALLGMAKVADWALVSPWQYDPSFLRNAYLYALSNSIGRWAPQTRFTEVFLKTDEAALGAQHYHGIGILTERIKIHSNLIPLQELAAGDIAGEAVTGGYILKIDPQDDDEFGWKTDRWNPGGSDTSTSLVVVSPKAAKLADEQRDYIQGYVQAFENALHADRDANWATRDYLGYIDRASWVDFHLLQVLAKNPDGLVRSAYFTKDRGGRIKAGPVWDFDRAMGSIDPRSQLWNEWHEAADGARLWETGWWGLLARDPDFMQAWVDRWQSLRRGALSNERLTALANTLAAQVDPAAVARDFARWEDNFSRFGTHRGEVDHLIGWLANRAGWIDGQFVAAPVPVTSSSGTEISAPAEMLLVYTLDGSDPRASGGGIAAGAITVNSFTLPAGSTATVRVYNPVTPTTVVGSQWSSALVVTGTSAPAPTTPVTGGQLAVLSTRAELGGGDARFTSTLVVSGSAKTFVIRAVGRTLTELGVEAALPDPALTIVSANGSVVGSNTDWHSGGQAASLSQQFAAVGAFPLSETPGDGRDAALVVELPPGTYSVEVASESGAPGVVLAEIFAVGVGSAVQSLSAQTNLGAEESFISGVGIAGTTARDVLLRAAGGAADATLAIYSGHALLGVNDNWSHATNAAAIASAAAQAGVAGLSPGSRDAALLLRLAPGTYTVLVAAQASSGPVVLEVIELP